MSCGTIRLIALTSCGLWRLVGNGDVRVDSARAIPPNTTFAGSARSLTWPRRNYDLLME